MPIRPWKMKLGDRSTHQRCVQESELASAKIPYTHHNTNFGGDCEHSFYWTCFWCTIVMSWRSLKTPRLVDYSKKNIHCQVLHNSVCNYCTTVGWPYLLISTPIIFYLVKNMWINHLFSIYMKCELKISITTRKWKRIERWGWMDWQMWLHCTKLRPWTRWSVRHSH